MVSTNSEPAIGEYNTESCTFHGRNIAIIAHAIVKEDSAVPDVDINRAIDRQQLFIADPVTHTYTEEQPDEQN